MGESIKGMKRTAYCAEFDMKNVGEEITAFGWVQRQRDLGNLIFIDLRDRTGIIQLSFNENTDKEILKRQKAPVPNGLLPQRALLPSVKAKTRKSQRAILRLW